MSERIYTYSETNNARKRVVLEREKYKGYEYIVVTNSSYPCAYISMPKTHIYYGVSDEVVANYIYAQEITFSDTFIFNGIPSKGFEGLEELIGWAYNDDGDYVVSLIPGRFPFKIEGEDDRKYTVEEIVQHCKEVIEELIELDK